ncbi:unnamed protein product [Scytosiphon promiscuus]
MASTDAEKALQDAPVVPVFSADEAKQEVEMKLDLEATSFSAQNAYFLAKMCKIAYETPDEVKGFLETNGFWGSGVSAGKMFEWFEASDEVASATTFDAIHDTEAFVAANDEAVIVTFRGSKGRRDWLTNLSILLRSIPENWKVHVPDGGLHLGFDDGVNTVWMPGPGHPEGMVAVIKEFLNAGGKTRKLYVTGHSLGAALATVAMARLTFVENMNVAAMYTMGGPKVFDTDVADLFDAKDNYGTALKDKCFRCRNNNDIVPRVPPFPYKHVGHEIYFDRFGAISTTSFVDRILGRFSALLRFSVIDGINDHGRTEYVRLLEQAVISSRISLVAKATSVVVDVAQKVLHVNEDAAKEQEEEVLAAKEAALEASTAEDVFVPDADSVPEHLVGAE